LENKKTIDINDLNKEFKDLESKLSILSNRFLAIAMDYKEYIKNDFSDHKIYELRDSVEYRFFSTRTHIEILLRQHLIIDEHMKSHLNGKVPIQMYFDYYQKQISSIFDSIVYHTTSIFDYISTLVNYISSKNNQKTLMWTQLSKSVRDEKNEFYKKSFAKTIDNIDRQFVSKLYDHRSFLIHRKSDISSFNVTVSFGKKENVDAKFMAGKNLIKSFNELKILDKENNLTVKYVTFWLVNETIEKITEILFALKREMENNTNPPEQFMFYLDPKTNERSSVSKIYWNEENNDIKKE